MRLIRRDPSPKEGEWPDDHSQQEFGIEKCDDWELNDEASTLTVDFKRFGRGDQRRSDFAVEVSWIDMRGFIQTFIEMDIQRPFTSNSSFNLRNQ